MLDRTAARGRARRGWPRVPPAPYWIMPMPLGPVFNAELMTTARRARYYVIRTVYGMVLLFFIAQNGVALLSYDSTGGPGEATIQQWSRLGRGLFVTYFAVQSAAVLMVAPAMVAGVIAEEKQRKTLQYLLASRLSSAEIVVGKLAARLLHVWVFLAIGLPITSLLSLFGGVDPAEGVLVFVGTMTTAFFLSALSILVSTLARRPREATSLAYLLEFVWLLGPTFLGLTASAAGPPWTGLYEWIRPVNELIAPTSPVHLLVRSRGGAATAVEPVLWMLGMQTAYGVLFVALAVAGLRRRARREGDGPRRTWARAIRRVQRILPRPGCGDDAMIWKECYVSRAGLATKVATGLLGLGAAWCVGYTAYTFGKPAFIELASYGYGAPGVETARNEFNYCLRVLCTLVYSVWVVGAAVASSSGLSGEREQDTWLSLIATPLEAWDVIRAKMLGSLWSVRWIGLVLVTLWLTGLAAGAVHPFGFAAVALETLVFVWFAVALGTCISLRARTSGRALLATVAIVVFLNGGYLVCFCPVGTGNLWLAGVGVTPMIEAISLASYQDVRTLMTGGWQSRRVDREAGAILTCFLGTLAYGLAAAALTHHAVARFDHEAGRPRRAGAIPPRARLEFDEAAAEPDDRLPEVDGEDPDVARGD